MNELKVDEKLNPLKPGEVFPNEFAMLAEMLGGLHEIEEIFISIQNKILRANMQVQLGEAGYEERMYNRVKYEFYNKLRTEINEFKKRKSVKR